MQATIDRHPREIVWTVNHEDGRVGLAVLPATLMASTSPLAAQANRVAATLQSIAEQANSANARFTPTARSEHLREVVKRAAPDVRALTAASIAEARAIAAADARIYEPGPLTNAPLESEIRQKFAALSEAEQASKIAALSVSETSALLRGGRDLSGVLNDNIWQMLLHQHALTAHVERTGLQADYQRKPDHLNPLAHGPDRAAAIASAEAALKVHDGRKAIVDDARNAVKSMIGTIALITDLDASAAYSLLMDGQAA